MTHTVVPVIQEGHTALDDAREEDEHAVVQYLEDIGKCSLSLASLMTWLILDPGIYFMCICHNDKKPYVIITCIQLLPC